MPFTNEVIGTNGVLIRNWLQSQNYIPGTSGWQITKSGAAEFNNGTFRGSIEVGPVAGQHFIVNNASTGDVIDVYNSSNQLIFSIDQNGELHSYNIPSATECDITGGLVIFNNTTPALQFGTGANIAFASGLVNKGQLKIDGGIPVGALSQTSLVLSADTVTNNQDIQATQRGITGDVVQTDQGVNVNNFYHADSYSGTTNASGHVLINHGCSFTPKGGVVTGTAPGGTFANLTAGVDGFTAIQADINWTVANTGAAWANSFITFDAIFWG